MSYTDAVDRVGVPLALFGALLLLGFFAVVIGGVGDAFWVFYGPMWVASLLFVAYRERVRGPAPSTDTTDPLFVLQQRYARGEIDEATFETKLDRLMGDPELDRAREATVGERQPEVEY